MLPETFLSSLAEIHALLMGLALGLSIGIALRFGYDATASFVLGVGFGATAVLADRGLLFVWPAHRHPWYFIVPAAVVGVLSAGVALRVRRGGPDAC